MLLEAAVTLAIVALLGSGATLGLVRAVGATLEAAERRAELAAWLRFSDAARRGAEAIELRPWAPAPEAHSGAAWVRRVPGGLEVAGTGSQPKVLRIVEVHGTGGRAVEIRIDHQTVARLTGIHSLDIGLRRGAHGQLLGIRLEVEHGRRGHRVLRLRFGTPGGTL